MQGGSAICACIRRDHGGSLFVMRDNRPEESLRDHDAHARGVTRGVSSSTASLSRVSLVLPGERGRGVIGAGRAARGSAATRVRQPAQRARPQAPSFRLGAHRGAGRAVQGRSQLGASVSVCRRWLPLVDGDELLAQAAQRSATCTPPRELSRPSWSTSGSEETLDLCWAATRQRRLLHRDGHLQAARIR